MFISVNYIQSPVCITMSHLEVCGRNRTCSALILYVAMVTMRTKSFNVKLPKILFVEFICGFRLLLGTKNRCSSKHEPTDLCNGAAVCFLGVRTDV
jgi:hypothetical protein